MYVNDYSKHSLNEVTVTYIKDKILSGELKRGDKLIESDISEHLRISRAPVREAMRELNVYGLVSFSPRRGNQILDLTPEELRELFEIRISLELQVLDILVKRDLLSLDNFLQLDSFVAQMAANEGKEMPYHEKLYNLNQLDVSFHSYLWHASGSRKRAQLLEGLFFQLLVTMNENVQTLGSFEEKAIEHANIVDALKSGDRDEVFAQFKKHLCKYAKAMLPDANLSLAT